MSIKSLQKAINSIGGQAELAKKLGKKQGHVSIWLTRDKKVPAVMALKIEQVTGVPRHELRPDLYPPEEYAVLCEVKQRQAVD